MDVPPSLSRVEAQALKLRTTALWISVRDDLPHLARFPGVPYQLDAQASEFLSQLGRFIRLRVDPG